MKRGQNPPLKEAELTWDALGEWTSKDFDFDYSVTYKVRFPKALMDGVAVEYEKPLVRVAWYIVKGREVIVSTRPLGGPFEWVKVFSLDEIWTGTEFVLEKTPPPFWSCHERASVIGEQFFFSEVLKGTETRMRAFVLRYPDNPRRYDWEAAVSFSNRMKRMLGTAGAFEG